MTLWGFKWLKKSMERKRPDPVLALQQREGSGGSEILCGLSVVVLLLAAGSSTRSKALPFLDSRMKFGWKREPPLAPVHGPCSAGEPKGGVQSSAGLQEETPADMRCSDLFHWGRLPPGVTQHLLWDLHEEPKVPHKGCRFPPHLKVPAFVHPLQTPHVGRAFRLAVVLTS